MKETSSNTDSNPLLLRAARSEIVERPPVWIMRQAGLYFVRVSGAMREIQFSTAV